MKWALAERLHKLTLLNPFGSVMNIPLYVCPSTQIELECTCSVCAVWAALALQWYTALHFAGTLQFDLGNQIR